MLTRPLSLLSQLVPRRGARTARQAALRRRDGALEFRKEGERGKGGNSERERERERGGGEAISDGEVDV